MTVAAFADAVGVSRNTMRKIVYRQRQPSLDLAHRIARATDGAVTEADLVVTRSDRIAA